MRRHFSINSTYNKSFNSLLPAIPVRILCSHFVFVKGEGVAYRGRILVELSTKLEGKADKTVDSIHSDDILVAQVQYWGDAHVILFDNGFYLRFGTLDDWKWIIFPYKIPGVTLKFQNMSFPKSEVPEEEKILSVRSLPQRLHDSGTRRTNPVWGQHR